MPEIIVTGDGSHSLLHHQLNETYHSTHGALQESQHVFIQMGLEEFALQAPHRIRVLEIGFGTGLNALLALKFSRAQRIPLVYHTLEAYPLGKEILDRLNYGTVLGMKEAFETLHGLSWGDSHLIDGTFEFRKTHILLEDASFSPGSADVVFYDAFAPSKQPELWTREILEKVCFSLAEGGVFVTYSARGQLKRDLRAIGLDVETLTGPPGKKEMVRAKKPALAL